MAFRAITFILRKLLIAILVISAVSAGFAVLSTFEFVVGLLASAGLDLHAIGSFLASNITMVAAVIAGVLAATVLAAFVWLFIAARRARRIADGTPRINPIWSFLGFMIPLLNLWLPHRVVSNIWRASTGREDRMEMELHPLISLWWFMSLVSVLGAAAEIASYVQATQAGQAYQPGMPLMIAIVTAFFMAWSFLGLISIIARNLAARDRGEEPSIRYWETKQIVRESH